MKVSRSQAVAVFAALGVPQAEEWSRRRMNNKVKDLPNHVEEDFTLEDDELNDRLRAMVEAVDSGEGVEVVKDTEFEDEPVAEAPVKEEPAKEPEPAAKAPETAPEQPKQKKGRRGRRGKKAAEKPAEEPKAEAPPEPKKDEGAKEEKAKDAKPAKAKPKAKAKKKKVKPSGVSKHSCSYLAGKVIGKHGLSTGITKTMVTEHTKLVGRTNEYRSKYDLSDAHHTIRGFSGEEFDGNLVGVRVSVTRPYLAGKIVAGLENGTGPTDESVVAELDDAFGRINPGESRLCLRRVEEIIEGYNAGQS